MKISDRSRWCELRGRMREAGVVALAVAVTFAGTAVRAAEAEKKAEPSEAELEQKLEAARKRLDAAAREVADLSMSLSGNYMPEVMAFSGFATPKAILGINLGSRSEERADGVEVVSVSPGGAAAEAGLKAGDVLVEANGKALKRDDSGSARRKLLDVMRDVKPGDKVAVSYRRDGKVAKVNVTAREPADQFFTRALPPMGAHGGARAFAFPGARFAFMRADGVFGSAELVPITPKLGQYFGTEKGLLVVRAPDDSRLKLEDGDVIVDIDGRTPSNASHALRILSSYQAGEKLKLNVLRQRKMMSFDVTIPEDAWEKSIDGAHFMPDVIAPAPGVPAVPATPGTRVEIQRLPAPQVISVFGGSTDDPV
jgi:predicted metalloprotease with PDZ domain